MRRHRYTTVSVATLSYYFAPILVTVVCPFLFRERMTGRQLLCSCMSTIGLILIIGVSGFGRSGTDLIGIAFGLGAAVFYAAVILLNKFIKQVTGIHRTFLQFLSAILILSPYVLMTGGVNLGDLSGSGWINLLIVACSIQALLTVCISHHSESCLDRRRRFSAIWTPLWQ